MIKILTLTAFAFTQLSLPYSYAQSNAQPVVNEFERSAQKMEEKIAAQKAAAEKKAQSQRLKNEIRKDVVTLTARTNELETLAENVPDVSEDVIESTAKSLRTTEEEYENRQTMQTASVVAVASGLVYTLTKFDAARAIAQGKASQSKTAAANVRVKSNPFNKGLKYLYGNNLVSKASATVGVIALAVLGVSYFENKPFSPTEIAAVKSLEHSYLSSLVSGGDTEYLSEEQIEDALETYQENAELRAAVLNEVRTIVAETERLTNSINSKREQLDAL